MSTEKSRATTRVDADGVKIIETSGVRRGVWLVLVLLAAVGLVVWFGVRSGNEAPATAMHATAAENAPRQPGGAASKSALNAPRVRIEQVAPAARRPDVPPRSEREPAAGATKAQSGTDAAQAEPSGVALFPPMGTDPIKRGIVVPDDFELPPGYVRHHQVTDDGQPLPPILMFHPDFQPVDDHGDPISIPEDRVVPPDLAPPGLAIQILEVPEGDANADAPAPQE